MSRREQRHLLIVQSHTLLRNNTMKPEQFKQIIRNIVREELSTQLKPAINEVMAKMLMEMSVTNRTSSLDNTKKARAIRESSYMDSIEEYKEYPEMDRNRLATLLGYGDTNGAGRGNTITIDHAMTEGGTPVPISPDQIPDHVINAMNKDYRSLMKSLENRGVGRNG